jgi:hypothetical protein
MNFNYVPVVVTLGEIIETESHKRWAQGVGNSNDQGSLLKGEGSREFAVAGS